MEYTSAVLYICIVLCPCVSTQIISTDRLKCSRDDTNDNEREVDYLVKLVKQQFILIQELSEKVQAQETLLKNISEKVYPVQTNEVDEEQQNENRTNISGQFGQHFILSFPYLREVQDITFLMVSLTNTAVTIHSSVEGVNRTVSISSSKGMSISLPTSLVRPESFKGNNTVTLNSDADIAVFALMTGVSGTGDGYVAIPRERLKNKYFFSMNNNAVLCFIAFYDNTVISITNTTGQTFHFLSIEPNGDSNTITLQKEEVVQLRLGGFMIGKVEGSKPFMILHGSYSDTPYSTYSTSYIDSIPDSDGNLFIVPYLSTVSESVTFCNAYESTVALSDFTVQKLRHNYVYIRNFDKGTFIQLDLNTTCHYIGHGFSVTIPSVQSYATYCRFLTPSHHNYTHHAVVMIQSEFEDSVKFSHIDNDQLVSPHKIEKTTADGTMYDVLYYDIDDGQFEVYHEMNDVRFGVITYGFGTDQQIAYGYPACFK